MNLESLAAFNGIAYGAVFDCIFENLARLDWIRSPFDVESHLNLGHPQPPVVREFIDS